MQQILHLVTLMHPLSWVWVIAAAGWLFSYRHLLRYEQLYRGGHGESEEDFRRIFSGMRIFATAIVLFMASRSFLS